MNTIVARRTLGGLIAERARTSPRRPFLIFDDLAGGVTRLHYARLHREVERTANVLRSLGVEAGERIHLHLPNCPEFLLLWFAAARLGAAIVPTNVTAPAAELDYPVRHSGCRLSFTTAARVDALGLDDAARRVVVVGAEPCRGIRRFTELGATAGTTLRDPPAVDPGAEAAVLYTSGTTAKPKGARVTHANYIYAGETVAKAIRLSPADRHCVALPLFHGNAQYYSTMSTLVAGASMALMTRFSASRYFECCIAHRCTVASLFAAPLRMLLAQERRARDRRNRLRVVLFAQNLTPAQLDEWHARFGAPLLQLWGMTETMGPPLMNPIDGPRRNMSIGWPVLGYEVRLVDDAGAPVPAGTVGQITVRGVPGVSLMAGYLDDAAASAETLRGEWLWSGDNAREDAEGYFHFVDRAKDMIKRSGENVAASEVEAVLHAHPDVFEAAVVGLPDPVRDERIVACVVAGPGSAPDAAALIAWCREHLAPFRVPERIVFLERLPRTSVGKIQKHRLRARLLGGKPSSE